jgi:glycerate dehydrogenase
LTFAHLLNLCHHVAEHGAVVRKGAWSQAKDFCFWEHPLVELSGRTMGLVGLGRIGLSVATVALAFGMDVIACDPKKTSCGTLNLRLADLQTVFQSGDVVSLHCPLTESNRGFVNKELLGLMKKNAFLINTGRGPLVDEVALAEALNLGTIAGAGLDVLTEEPPKSGSPLLSARNCYITPHIAWATLEARRRLMKTAFENVESFLRGKAVNEVK